MCLLAQRSRPAQRRALRFVACIGIVAMAAPLAQAWTLWPIVHSGVVIVGKAEARGSPVNLGDPAFTLPAGEEVRIAAAYRGYVLVMTRTGRSGWITAESIVPIVPP